MQAEAKRMLLQTEWKHNRCICRRPYISHGWFLSCTVTFLRVSLATLGPFREGQEKPQMDVDGILSADYTATMQEEHRDGALAWLKDKDVLHSSEWRDLCTQTCRHSWVFLHSVKQKRKSTFHTSQIRAEPQCAHWIYPSWLFMIIWADMQWPATFPIWIYCAEVVSPLLGAQTGDYGYFCSPEKEKKKHFRPTPKLGLRYKCRMVFSMTWYIFLQANDVLEDRYDYEKWSHADSQGRESCRRRCSSFFFLSRPFFWLISIAILGSRGPFPAVHTCCDLYSK